VLVQWCPGTAPPMAVLLAVQPAGFLLLLALSIAHHVGARTIAPSTTVIVSGESAAGASGRRADSSPGSFCRQIMRYFARDGASKFLLASLALLLLSSTVFHRLGYRVLPQEAPPARNAEVARSVWRTFSLEAPGFRVFEQELR